MWFGLLTDPVWFWLVEVTVVASTLFTSISGHLRKKKHPLISLSKQEGVKTCEIHNISAFDVIRVSWWCDDFSNLIFYFKRVKQKHIQTHWFWDTAVSVSMFIGRSGPFIRVVDELGCSTAKHKRVLLFFLYSKVSELRPHQVWPKVTLLNKRQHLSVVIFCLVAIWP